MSQKENNIHGKISGALKDDMDREPIGDRLNSDNAFSDKGLNNARLTSEAVKKENQ
ncbi:hypothetical protein MKZ02_12225 [Pseudobacillus sp. FSL P4-0506]|uniref:hypothetical protein n=1 Tax=unclassified Pseudobacillus TaxID=2619284 RepID=UPI0030FBAD4C